MNNNNSNNNQDDSINPRYWNVRFLTLAIVIVTAFTATLMMTIRTEDEVDRNNNIDRLGGVTTPTSRHHNSFIRKLEEGPPIIEAVVEEIVVSEIGFGPPPVNEEDIVYEVGADNNDNETSTIDQIIEEEVKELEEEANEETGLDKIEVALPNEDESFLIEAMKKKLQPKNIIYMDDPETKQKKFRIHQFLHLHHMKTGGTSFDRLLNCGKSRIEQLYNTRIPYTNIHECSEFAYQTCYDGSNAYCKSQINDASIMSYCAPLKDLVNPFNWSEALNSDSPPEDVDIDKIYAVTVFRNPVARVWSMYRFQTKNCYACRSLIDVYNDIDSGNSAIRPMCQSQLQNHLTRNILSDGSITDPLEKIENAKMNLKSFFTIVGLTEDMTTTTQMIGKVFPWLDEYYEDSQMKCTMPHANSSPLNNYCGPNGGHMPLPDVPDEETTKAIIQHNQLDMELYATALEQFRLQKIALDL